MGSTSHLTDLTVATRKGQEIIRLFDGKKKKEKKNQKRDLYYIHSHKEYLYNSIIKKKCKKNKT